jgi:uncharacterized protein YjbI with pentapeptide repeats
MPEETDTGFVFDVGETRTRHRVSRQTALLWVAFDDLDSLRDADLTEMDFSRSDLWGVDFRRLNLRGCDFSYANLLGSDLRNADVRECDFTGVYLGHTHLAGALYNEDTRFPDDYDPVTNLMMFVGRDV